MAIVVKDRVKVTFTTTGTADFTLGAAATGFQSFAAIGNTNFTYYAAVDPATGDWEVGYGQYLTAGPTLTRNTILSSSAAGAKVSFGSGNKDVFCTYPSEKAIYEELSGNVLIDGGPLTVVGSGVTTYTTFSAALAEMYGNVNSFAQLYAQNLSNGSSASTDIVAYNNLGDGTNNFIDMGIASSNYTEVAFPIFSPGSGYLYNDGGDLLIGSATDDVVLFAGGVALSDEALRIDKTSLAVTITGAVNVGGALDVNGAADIAGATVFGSTVTLNANPSLALQAATKQYVDNQVTAGLHIHEPVRVETTGNLTATYAQGGTTFNITDITSTTTVTTSVSHGLAVNDQIWLYTSAGNGLSTNTAYFVYSIPAVNQLTLSLTFGGAQITGLTNASGLTYATRANSGVGATLTNSGAQAALVVDGIALSTTNRVMVRLQTNGAENGVYTVTTVGSGSTNWVLTRATDSNQVNPSDPNGVGTGDYYFTQEGVINAGDSHVLTTEPNTMIIGYTTLTYTQFSGSVDYVGGTNINITGQTISLTGTVAPTNGGTGVNTVTTGDLLYGSATNTWSKLPLGSGYKSLTVNAGGTQVEWNAVALDQSGAVSGTLPATSGGTGQTTYTVGDTLYSGTTNNLAKLAGNTTTTKKFLGQTGTGAASAAPIWEQPAASDITGLAPSATTDTTNASNITSGTLGTSRLSGSYTGVTGVGTLTAGTWNASVIGAVYGGTGQSSYAVGDLVYADTTTSLAKLADVAVGNALISGGVGSAPSYGKIGLATHVSGILPIANGGTGTASTQFVDLAANVTGTLPVGNGGTGAATLTANNVLLGNGTSALQVVAPGANGNVLQSNGTTWVSAVNPSSQVYPGAGIANSTGTSWATSYSTTGSGTVVALATSPTFVTNISVSTGGSNTLYVGRNTGATTYNSISLNGNSSDSGNMGLTGGASGDNTLYVNAPGNIVLRTSSFGNTNTLSSFAEFAGSVRAPIFYDSDNTTYYVDPANGGFNLRGGSSNRVTYVSSDSGIVVSNAEGAGGGVRLGAAYNLPGIYNGGSLYLCSESTISFNPVGGGQRGYIDGSSNLFAFGSMRSPIFYDYNDTGYYLDPNSTSQTAERIRGGTLHGPNTTWSAYLLVGGNGRDGYIDNTTVASVCTTNGNLHMDAASGTDMYLNYYDGVNINIGNGALATVSSLNGGDGSHRAQIFYDYNNTAYYLDPASTGTALNVNGNIDLFARSAAWAEGIRVRVPTRANWGGIRFTRDEANSNGNWAIGYTGINSTDDLTFWGNSGGSESMKAILDLSANFTAYGSSRAPIFYDSNNTGYYLDPASTSVLNFISGSISDITNNGTGIYASQSGTSYSNVVCVREAGRGGAGASQPRLGFHWSGVVASSIAMEASGRIAIMNNPGNAYESFVCGTITAPNLIAQGQTMTNVTGSRAIGTTYTNSTGRPIVVYVTIAGVFQVSIFMNGTSFGTNGNSTGYNNMVSFIVPDGSTYSVNTASGGPGLQLWWELR